MLIYIGIIIFSLFFAFLLRAKNYSCGKNYAIFFMFLLFLMAALRASSIGNDTANYLRIYTIIQKGNFIEGWEERFEPGYLILNRLLASFFQEQQIILLVTSIIIYGGFLYFIVKFSSNVWLSVFLFITLGYFGQSLNTIRLCIAYSILLFSYSFLRKKQFITFVIIVLLATMFHRTAIIFLLAYFVQNIKLNKWIFGIWVIFTATVTIYMQVFLDILFKIYPTFQYYIGTNYVSSGKLASILYLLIWLLVLIFGLAIQWKKRGETISKDISIMTFFMMIAVSIYSFSLRFNLLDRIAQFFSMFGIVYIPNTLELIKSKRKKYILTMIIVMLFFSYFVTIQVFRPEWNVIYPYKTFWMDK